LPDKQSKRKKRLQLPAIVGGKIQKNKPELGCKKEGERLNGNPQGKTRCYGKEVKVARMVKFKKKDKGTASHTRRGGREEMGNYQRK